MDIKSEIEIKGEPLESSEENITNNGQSFQQDSGLEEIQTKSFVLNINVKKEIDIKDEAVDIKEGYLENSQHVKETSGFDESERKCFDPNVDVKEEIDIKDEAVDFNEEYSENSQHVEKTSGLDKSELQLTALNIKRMDTHAEKLILRGRIIALFESGQSRNHIARNLGIHVSTVRRWLVRHEKEGNLCDRPKPGAPRKTTQNEDEQIIEEAISDPFTNSRAIKRVLQLEASDKTIRRRLHAYRKHHRNPAVEQKLSEAHKAKRLRFGNEYVYKDMNFWSKVIFTDEKTFCSSDHGLLHCWRVNNTQCENQHTYEEARCEHVTANVWGWINFNIVGELTPIDGRFTADKY